MAKKRYNSNAKWKTKGCLLNGQIEADYLGNVPYDGYVGNKTYNRLVSELESANSIIDKPVITSPVNGFVVTGNSLVVSSSQYSITGIEDKQHVSTTYQIATDNTFTNLIYDSTTATPTTTKIIPINTNGSFVLRIRYNSNNWTSEWSDIVNFSRNYIPGILTPSILTDGGVNRLLESSAFGTDPGFVGAHDSSDWEVALDSGFTSVILSAYSDSIQKTSLNISNLLTGTQYYARVRYRSGATVSSWSNPYGFITQVYLPPPELTYPSLQGTDPILDVFLKDYNGGPPRTDVVVRIVVKRRYTPTATWFTSLNTTYTINDYGNYSAPAYTISQSIPKTYYEITITYEHTPTNTASDPTVINLTLYKNSWAIQPTSLYKAPTGELFYKMYDPLYYGQSIPITAVRWQIFDDRRFINPVYEVVYNYDGSNDIDRRFYPSPVYEESYGKEIHYFDIGKYYYVRCQYISGGITSPWSSSRIFDLRNKYYIQKPNIVAPFNGETNVNDTVVRMTNAITVSTAQEPTRSNLFGVHVVIGDSIDQNGEINNVIEDAYYYNPRETRSGIYPTGALSNNKTFYIKVRYICKPLGDKCFSEWSDIVSFTTGNSISNFPDVSDFKVGGMTTYGVASRPLIYQANRLYNEDQNKSAISYYITDVNGKLVQIGGWESSILNYTLNVPDVYMYFVREDLNLNQTYRLYYRRNIVTKEIGALTSNVSSTWSSVQITPTRQFHARERMTDPPNLGTRTIRTVYAKGSAVNFNEYIIQFADNNIDMQVEYYNVASDSWTIGASTSRRRNRYTAIFNEYTGLAEVYGHRTDSNSNLDGKNYNVLTNTWSPGNTLYPNYTLVRDNYGVYHPGKGSIISLGRFYQSGGVLDGITVMWDDVTGVRSEKPPLFTPIWNSQPVVGSDNKLYYLGMSYTAAVGTSYDVWSLDVINSWGGWGYHDTLPLPIKNGYCIKLKDDIMVVNTLGKPNRFRNILWTYDINNKVLEPIYTIAVRGVYRLSGKGDGICYASYRARLYRFKLIV